MAHWLCEFVWHLNEMTTKKVNINMKHFLFKFIALLFLSISLSSAHASVELYPMSLTITADDKGLGQIRIISKSDSVQYIKVSVNRVTAPGTDHEGSEPTSPLNAQDLVASPQRLVLPAGGSHVVRLISQQAPEKETLYRVAVEPVPPLPGEADTQAGPPTEVKSDVGLVVVWAALVTVEPKHIAPKWTLNDNRDTLINTGNIRLGVLRAGHCNSPTDENSCEWLSVQRIVYAGQQLALPAYRGSAPYFRIEYKTNGTQVHHQAWEP